MQGKENVGPAKKRKTVTGIHMHMFISHYMYMYV